MKAYFGALIASIAAAIVSIFPAAKLNSLAISALDCLDCLK